MTTAARVHRIVFDASSKRRFDENGFLHVEANPVTKEQIAPYYGAEIQGWDELGLDPDRVYHAYRSGEELAKAARTFNGMPLLLGHHVESAEKPQKEHRVGSLGTDAVFSAPYVRVTLIITDAEAIEAIENGAAREISAGYAFDPVFTPGTFEGQAYDFVMTNIRANHVALVEEGRAGTDVAVEDAKNTLKTRGYTMSKMSKAVAWAKRVLARDAKKRGMARDADPAIEKAEVDAAKEILAVNKVEAKEEGLAPKEEGLDEDKDAKIKEILALCPDLPEEAKKKLADALQGLAYDPDSRAADEDPEAQDSDEDAPKAPGAEDEDAAAMDAEEVKAALDACGLDAESPEFQKAFAEGVKYGEKKEKEEPGKLDSEHESEGAKKAMDAALRRMRRAPALAADAAINHMRSLHEAARTVRPLVGELVDPLAFDSAEAIYGKALDMAGLRKADYPRSAWRGMCDVLINQRTGGFPASAAPMAADAKADPALANLSRIRVEA